MSLHNIIGHDNAVRIFLGTIKRNRVPSSVLISGDSGIGKRFAAINYAKALNCLEPSGSDACDSCISCRKIDGETHPDIAWINPENDEIKIEAVREVSALLSLRPYEGRRKVLIIDDADMMNINAANAFLKTLEEPPQDSVIILVSSSPDRLPETIRSRCMHIRFRPLSGEAFSKVLNLKELGKSPEAFSSLTAGRPGISRDFAKEKKWFEDILSSMTRGEPRCSWTDKNDMKQWLDLSFVLLRDMAVSGISGDHVLLFGANPPANIKKVLNAYQSLQKVRGLIDLNINKAITWNFVSGIIQDVVEPSAGLTRK